MSEDSFLVAQLWNVGVFVKLGVGVCLLSPKGSIRLVFLANGGRWTTFSLFPTPAFVFTLLKANWSGKKKCACHQSTQNRQNKTNGLSVSAGTADVGWKMTGDSALHTFGICALATPLTFLPEEVCASVSNMQMIQKPFSLFFSWSICFSLHTFLLFLSCPHSTLHTPHLLTFSLTLASFPPPQTYSGHPPTTDHTQDKDSNSAHSIETFTPLFFLHATTLFSIFVELDQHPSSTSFSSFLPRTIT